MKIRTVKMLLLCFILVTLPLSGCSAEITEPQEVVFNFLDQILSGDPQLISDAYSYVHYTKNKSEADAFGAEFKQRLSQMKTKQGEYITKVFLIAENKSKPQTATISSQYLRVPDLGVFREIELHKVNDRWLIQDQSSLDMISDILNPDVKTNPQTPNAGTWHEGEIQVHSTFTDRWDGLLQN